MKANAKKLLALIMAMVMSLSLAAPAMAAGADAVADASLNVQAAATITDLWVTATTANANGYTVTTSDGLTYPSSGVYAWNETCKFVDVTAVDMPVDVLVGGEKKVTKYTVKAKDVYATSTDTSKAAKTVTVADTADLFKLTDTDFQSKFVELTSAQDYYKDGGKTYQRKGFMYSEKQPNGSWKHYFKLYPANNDGKSFNTSSNKWYYAVSATTTALKEDADIRTALSDLTVVAPDGFVSGTTSFTNFYKDMDTIPSAYTVDLETATGTVYTYDFEKVDSKVLNVSGTGTTSPSIDFALTYDSATDSYVYVDDVTATFTTRLTYKSGDKTEIESDSAKVKSAIAAFGYVEAYDAYKWTVTSVSDTATNGYWTVTIQRNTGFGTLATAKSDYAVGTNASFYRQDVLTASGTISSIEKAGLTDTAKDGTYMDAAQDGKDKKDQVETVIAKGTQVLGPVAVFDADIPAEVDIATDTSLGYLDEGTKDGKTFKVYSSVDALTASLTNNNCASEKKVAYKQLVMNKVINGTDNKVDLTGTGVSGDPYWVKDQIAWVSNSNATTVSGTVTKAKSKTHLTPVKEVTVVDPTCQADGSRTITEKCKDCGDIISTKTETINKITVAVQKGKEADGWVMKSIDAQWYKADGSKWVSGTDDPSTKAYQHYISEYEVKVTPATKTEPGSYEKTAKCNLGCAHPELSEKKELNKSDLEHSGKWTSNSWGTQNTQYARDPQRLFGFAPTVHDVDIDYPDVPLNGKNDTYFGTGSSAQATAMPDGTYYYELPELDYQGAAVTPASTTITATVPSADRKTKTTFTYKTILTITNIKNGEKQCQDGSALMTVSTYKVTNANVKIDPANLEDSLKNKKAELVSSFDKTYTIPAEKTHIDANNDGKCDNCGAEINQSTTDNENTVDISKAVVKFGALTYTGKVAQPSVTVTLDGVKLAKGVDYEVEELQAVNAGTYPLVVKGKGDFSGRAVGNVTIKKAKNTIKVSKSTLTFKVKDLKKKAKSAALKVTKNKGKVSYKSSNKKVTWKSSKVTVAKKTKKGTYKLTFTAKGNANYKKGTKTVKVVVK